MFNPLVDSFEELSDQEVENKIFELTKKYWQSSRNPELQNQVLTVLNMYKMEMQARQAKQQIKNQDEGDNSLDNLINVS